MEPLYSPQSRAERLIAAGRVVLASSSLFAVWLDPTEPAKYANVAYSLLAAYVVYAVSIAVLVWRADAPSHRQGLVTHAFDFAFFTLFIYFTRGPLSPFNTFFVFALVCATLRWQWRGTLWTAIATLTAFFGLGLYFSLILQDPDFQLYPLIVRSVYLAVVAVLLGYLGAHEERTRRDMTALAAWPQTVDQDIEPLVRTLLEHAARALQAPRAVLAWVEREEPWLYVASWSGDGFSWTRAAPAAFGGLVAPALAGCGFLCFDAAAAEPAVLRRGPDGLQRWRGAPVDPAFLARYPLRSVLCLPLRADSAEGRLFLADKAAMTSDDLVLGEIVAGVVAARLDLFYLHRTLEEAATTEERIRLARDLHDGVLQSLTGIGLRLAAVRGVLDDPRAARDALEALQRLISLEQRDLRFFIEELKPPPLAATAGEGPGLALRLGELAQRMELEWGLRSELRIEETGERLPEALTREIYLVVREALVNAVRHGEASAVRVTIALDAQSRLAVTVADNGRGFPVHGRWSHAALADEKLGPRSLLERVESLRGTVSLESSASGARLEIAVPAGPAAPLATGA
jgi:signal transduction histidine kinase